MVRTTFHVYMAEDAPSIRNKTPILLWLSTTRLDTLEHVEIDPDQKQELLLKAQTAMNDFDPEWDVPGVTP